MEVDQVPDLAGALVANQADFRPADGQPVLNLASSGVALLAGVGSCLCTAPCFCIPVILGTQFLSLIETLNLSILSELEAVLNVHDLPLA